MKVGKKTVKVHRLSWELANGPIPPGLNALHHCDNPPCVNPAHLFLGTQAENVRDMEAKGRAYHPCGARNGRFTKPGSNPRGERNGQSKLTEIGVREIRDSVAIRGESRVAVALRFGVSAGLVGQIVRRSAWHHVA
ncbi:MAG: HNH endonuclease signature motif containing protein [Candidatus Thermoplasmatota archaeon]|jgi:hypothetical protein